MYLNGHLVNSFCQEDGGNEWVLQPYTFQMLEREREREREREMSLKCSCYRIQKFPSLPWKIMENEWPMPMQNDIRKVRVSAALVGEIVYTSAQIYIYIYI